MNRQLVQVEQFFSNRAFPYGLRLIYPPSGARVEGNCRTEAQVAVLRDELMEILESMVSKDEQADEDLLDEEQIVEANGTHENFGARRKPGRPRKVI